MAFCSKCGAQIADDAKVCPSCGAQTETASAGEDLGAKVAALNNTADTTAEFDPQDIQNNKVMGILAYLSWLVLIPIFAAKDSKFARFHVNQGLVLAIAELILGVISAILSGIPVIGVIISIVCWLGNIGCFVLAILGIINAANGKAKELPLIGSFRILK